MIRNFLIKALEFFVWRIAIIYARAPWGYKNNWDWFKDCCPFCDPKKYQVIAWYKKRILIQNKFPYPNHKHHLLLIPRRHIENPSNLTTQELKEMVKIEEVACEAFNAMRVSRVYPHAQASVRHYHIHFISYD